jgi:hypothetical protein
MIHFFRSRKVRIFVEGGEHVVVDHNMTANDVQIEIKDAQHVEIRGNDTEGLQWWRTPLGIVGLAVVAGLIVAGVRFYAGWE